MSTADLIITNARVYTVDNTNPRAEAVAMAGNRITYVGDEAGAQALRGSTTRVIDGQGKTLLPGIIDSHFHLLWGSATLYGAQLYEVKTMDELATNIHAWMAQNPAAEWVLGDGLSYALPDNNTPLTRHDLDKIVADKPLFLTAFDQHSTFANTAGLEKAKILHNPPQNLPNGEVVVGADGLATGELYEMDAMDLVRNALPRPTRAEQINTVRKGLALSASMGITSIHNMDGDLEQAELYSQMAEQGDLTLRIVMPFWAKPEMDLQSVLAGATAIQNLYQNDGVMLKGGLVKFFMDGVYESFSAVTVDGYPDTTSTMDAPIWAADRFAEFATAIDAKGMQIAVHAVGDGAVRNVLDGYEIAQKTNGTRDSRHRIEHIEMVRLDDLPRFAELGVIASMQPLHSPLEENDPEPWLTRIDPSQWDRGFAWRKMRDAGARLVFGSDWPVVTMDPYLGIFGAVNRQPWRAGLPTQQQTLAEAIRGYTCDGAYAEFAEEKKGQIKVGQLADVVLLSADIFALPTEELNTVQALLTICNGQVVFERA